MEVKITIVSMLFDGVKEHRSTARTWGQLKEELNALGIPVNSDTKGMNRDARVHFTSDSDSLPSTEWTLFLSPKEKIKSGN